MLCNLYANGHSLTIVPGMFFHGGISPFFPDSKRAVVSFGQKNGCQVYVKKLPLGSLPRKIVAR